MNWEKVVSFVILLLLIVSIFNSNAEHFDNTPTLIIDSSPFISESNVVEVPYPSPSPRGAPRAPVRNLSSSRSNQSSINTSRPILLSCRVLPQPNTAGRQNLLGSSARSPTKTPSPITPPRSVAPVVDNIAENVASNRYGQLTVKSVRPNFPLPAEWKSMFYDYPVPVAQI